MQLNADLVDEFDIGYIQSNMVVSLRSSRDIQEIWSNILNSESITLWCDGLRKEDWSGAKKRPNKSVQEESDDDEDSEMTKKKKKKKSEEREEQVESTMEQLQSMHTKKYTQM